MSATFFEQFLIAWGILVGVFAFLVALACGVEKLIRRVQRWRESRIEYPF